MDSLRNFSTGVILPLDLVASDRRTSRDLSGSYIQVDKTADGREFLSQTTKKAEATSLSHVSLDAQDKQFLETLKQKNCIPGFCGRIERVLKNLQHRHNNKVEEDQYYEERKAKQKKELAELEAQVAAEKEL